MTDINKLGAQIDGLISGFALEALMAHRKNEAGAPTAYNTMIDLISVLELSHIKTIICTVESVLRSEDDKEFAQESMKELVRACTADFESNLHLALEDFTEMNGDPLDPNKGLREELLEAKT